MSRFAIYRETGVFGETSGSGEILHINPKDVVSNARQRVYVIVSQPKFAARRTEAAHVFGPRAEEINRAVDVSLAHL